MIKLSIIVPVKSGDDKWKTLLNSVSLTEEIEVLFVGPDFSDSFEQIRFVHCSGNRAAKLNTGVLKSKGSTLLFLHADSIFTKTHLEKIISYHSSGNESLMHFDLAFDAGGLMKINEFFANLRSNFLKMPFGDQAFFVKKCTFLKLGFFDEHAAFGEDHLLVWKAHQQGIKVESAEIKIITSSRKYLAQGWLQTTLKHLILTYVQAFPELIKIPQSRYSRSKQAIAVFVKTPGHSSVKTRLAEKIGREKAEEFFLLSLKALEEISLHLIKESKGEIIVYWAVSEETALDHALWSSLPRLCQGAGTLGERLFSIQQQLRKKHNNLYFIGADSPQLQVADLMKVLNLSRQKPFLLGKTEDGGFYLYGATKELPKELWTDINYSTATTAEELIRKVGSEKFTFLPHNFDVDYNEDLARLAGLSPDDYSLDSQKAVINWARLNCR